MSCKANKYNDAGTGDLGVLNPLRVNAATSKSKKVISSSSLTNGESESIFSAMLKPGASAPFFSRKLLHLMVKGTSLYFFAHGFLIRNVFVITSAFR